MALADIGRLFYPNFAPLIATTISTGFPLFSTSANYKLSAANTRLAMVFPAFRAGTVTHVAIRVRAATTPQALRVGLYAVDTEGDPTTTAYGGSAHGTIAVPAANTIHEVALGTPATLTAGDVVAVVVEWDATQGDVDLAAYNSSAGRDRGYAARYAGTSWSPDYRDLWHLLKFDDGAYASSAPMQDSTAVRNVNSGTSEYGLVLPIPFRCRAVGLYGFFAASAALAGSVVGRVYSGTTELASGTIDADAIFPAQGSGCSSWRLASPVTLDAGTYHLGLTSTLSGGSLTLYCPTVGANAHLDAFPAGRDCHQATRSGGAWTDVATEYTPIGLVIDQIDDGTGAGGGGIVGGVFGSPIIRGL